MLHKSFVTAALPAFLSLALLLPSGAFAAVTSGAAPHLPSQPLDQGPADLNEEVTLTVHLNLTNKEAFDKAVEDLYNPQSPNYEHWMTNADLQKYAPSPAALAAVKNELVKNGFSVLSVDPLGFSIRVHGTVASAQKAFQTELHQFTREKETYRAPTQAAHLTGGADAYVRAVAGLNNHKVHPTAKRAVNQKTGIGSKPIPFSTAAAAGLGSIITDNCFGAPSPFTFTTPGAALPVGIYYGNVYSPNPNKTCDFTSAQLQAHYGLPAAYAKGYDGHGENVVVVEAYGYPTIEADANAFSKLNGLPALDSSTFEIVYPEGKPNPELGVLAGWDIEIALDVQWSHTIAPKAKIIVVATVGEDNEDFQDSLNYVINNKLGSSISNSWEEDQDLFAGPDELASYDAVLEKAAAKGISVNFSSGDDGDGGIGTPIGAPGVPADNPWATAVGGTAIINNLNGSSFEVGWGSAQGELSYLGPLDPPFPGEFIGGAGGGESVWYKKPSWQSSLPGTGRQVPDVSALSDPYTGVPIVLTVDGEQGVEVGWGGTSLGCPIFSAFWVLANQAAGHSLGLAAAKLPKATGTEVTDIVPHTSTTNPSGIVYDSMGSTYYSPADLFSYALSLGTATDFIGGITPNAYGETGLYLIQGFGLDSSLTITKGWDNVTGWGAPNGLAFIEGFK